MAVKKEFSYKYESAWSDANELLLCLDTGTWRKKRPVIDQERCTYCCSCALYCPPQCMTILSDHLEPNLSFCKGCGICAKECPRKAITMVAEEQFSENNAKK
jgi:pyruvate ferredoxin oxidoreductase delta subunit